MAYGSLTLLQLKTQSRERADMKNANGVYTNAFITDSELTAYINESYYELYDILVSKIGDDYFVAPPLQFEADGESLLYPLPDGTNYDEAPPLYKFMGLDLALGGATDAASWVTLRPFMFADRNRYAVPNFQSFYGVTNLRYRLNGSNLFLTPIASAGQILQLWYVPRLIELVEDEDIADGVSGWLEYVIVDVAIKMLNKEESDVSVLMAQKMALLKRIEAMAEHRDAGNPQVVSDTQWQDYMFPSGGGSPYGGGS